VQLIDAANVVDVPNYGDQQVDRDRADDVNLLAGEAALLQQFHHVEHSIDFVKPT
jgi:hypothetical protein